LPVPALFFFFVIVVHVLMLLPPLLYIDGFSTQALKFGLGLARAGKIYYFTEPE
jgi:hypothetical protein